MNIPYDKAEAQTNTIWVSPCAGSCRVRFFFGFVLSWGYAKKWCMKLRIGDCKAVFTSFQLN